MAVTRDELVITEPGDKLMIVIGCIALFMTLGWNEFLAGYGLMSNILWVLIIILWIIVILFYIYLIIEMIKEIIKACR